MKLPLSIVKQFTKVELDTERLVKEISEKICNIEEVEDISKEYENVVVGEIKEKQNHPDADKLAIYKLDIGEKDLIQVVAGDKTLEEGEKVAFFKPGASIPYSEEEFIIKIVNMRGVESQGMMASEKELNLGPDHTKVMRLDSDAKIGQPFAEYYGLDDIVIDIENKGLTNRGDLFGIIGLAREISAIQGRQFVSPEWISETKLKEPKKECLRLKIENDAESVCQRYVGIALENVSITESPTWLKVALIKGGLRPINNVVDITNYLMLLTGQPLHAFDYDKVIKHDLAQEDEAQIVVRMAKNGEKIRIINGDVIELTDRNLVIADSSNPIAIAGVMGGIDTEVDENTKRVILESANFDRFNIRRTSMQHGLNTDASDRFKRSQDPNMCLPVLIKAVNMLEELSNSEVATSVIDIYPSPTESKTISFDINRMNQVLGIHLEYDEVAEILSNLEYSVMAKEGVDGYISVHVPTFRKDISIPEDIYEDIGRIYGYEKITVSLPNIEMKPSKTPLILKAKEKISQILSNSGSNEIITYNFTSADTLKKTKQDPNICYHIKNAISPDLEYMRPSLIPSLIEKISMNLNKGHKEVSLFESNISHQKDVLDNDELPLENWYLSFIYANKDEKRFDGSSYYMAKRYLEKVLNGLGIEKVKYTLAMDYNLENASVWLKNISNTFDLNASAVITNEENNDVIGILGDISTEVKVNFGLPVYTSAFEINISKIVSSKKISKYVKEPIYPAISRDICLLVPDGVQYVDIEDELSKLLNARDLYSKLECLDIYKAKETDKVKKITFTLSIQNYNKTLDEKDYQKIYKKVEKQLKNKFKIEIE